MDLNCEDIAWMFAKFYIIHILTRLIELGYINDYVKPSIIISLFWI